MHNNLADVADARQLVGIQVGIQHPPGHLVHDFLFEERVANAHGYGAVTLVLGGLQVNDEPAVLHCHHFVDLDDAGLGVHGDVSDLHAAHTARTELAGTGILPLHLNGFHSQLAAGLLPGGLFAASPLT